MIAMVKANTPPSLIKLCASPDVDCKRYAIMTLSNLAANMESQDDGCPAYKKCPAIRNGHCACTNCKYADHAGSIIIALDYE